MLKYLLLHFYLLCPRNFWYYKELNCILPISALTMIRTDAAFLPIFGFYVCKLSKEAQQLQTDIQLSPHLFQHSNTHYNPYLYFESFLHLLYPHWRWQIPAQYCTAHSWKLTKDSLLFSHNSHCPKRFFFVLDDTCKCPRPLQHCSMPKTLLYKVKNGI